MIDNETLIAALKKTVSYLKREIFTAELARKALVFIFQNDKIKGAYTFSLPSGWTCPGAVQCLAKANRETGKLTHGPEQVYRCFSASQEAIYPPVRLIRWHNFELLKQAKELQKLVDLITASLPQDAKRIRVHVAGDFYNQTYFDAWMLVAEAHPEILFYAYTKSANFWANRIPEIPANFKLNSSVGGRFDEMAKGYGFKTVQVVNAEADAAALGLEIDEDDSHAWAQDKSFALLVHGTQPPGSAASKSWSAQLKEIKKANAALPAKIKRAVRPLTVAGLTAQIIRLAARLAKILLTPEYVVA